MSRTRIIAFAILSLCFLPVQAHAGFAKRKTCFALINQIVQNYGHPPITRDTKWTDNFWSGKNGDEKTEDLQNYHLVVDLNATLEIDIPRYLDDYNTFGDLADLVKKETGDDCVAKFDRLPCPCKYRDPALRYLTARHPIPPAQVACLKPKDDYVKLAREIYDRTTDGGLGHMTAAVKFIIEQRPSWGPPPISVAQEILSYAKKNIEKDRAQLASDQREVKQDKREFSHPVHSGPKMSNPLDERALSKLEDMVAGVEDDTLLEAKEDAMISLLKVTKDETDIAYAKCVIKNNLPPESESN